MDNVSLQSIKARYRELFPLGVDKQEFIKTLEYVRDIEDKRVIISCKDLNFKPYMVAFLLKYLSNHDRYPSLLSLNVHEIVEIYLNGSQDGEHIRLTDIKEDILFLNAGFNEPNNKVLKECISYIMTNYVTQDKYLLVYLRGTSMLVKDIEGIGKDLNIPQYNISSIQTTKPIKVNKDSKVSKSNLF